MMVCRSALLCVCVVGLSLILGCGGSRGASVQGEVKLDGQPVEAGSIAFLPPGDSGSKAAAAIEGGKYVVPPETVLAPGTYRVEINWLKPTGRQIPSADPGIMMEERQEAVPAKFNTESTLTAEIGAGENVKNFDLSSQ